MEKLSCIIISIIVTLFSMKLSMWLWHTPIKTPDRIVWNMTWKVLVRSKRILSLGINEVESRGQPDNPGSPGKWPLKWSVCVCVNVVIYWLLDCITVSGLTQSVGVSLVKCHCSNMQRLSWESGPESGPHPKPLWPWKTGRWNKSRECSYLALCW